MTFLTVKDVVKRKISRQLISPGKLDYDLESYFQDILTSSEEDVIFFPGAMKIFLSTTHKKVYSMLEKLNDEGIFILLGKSLIVTLNIDNARVRIPTTLICDACVFSSTKPIFVLSFVKNGYNRQRLEMYNTFLARGITEGLRIFLNDNISVLKTVVEEESDISVIVKHLLDNVSPFQIPSSLSVCKEMAVEAATALLRYMAVASSYSLLYPEQRKPNSTFFLNVNEFECLANILDMEYSTEKMYGERNLLALEMSMRVAKRAKTALIIRQLVQEEKAHPHQVNTLRNLEVFFSSAPQVFSEYKFIITDTQKNVESMDIGRKTRIVVLSSKKDLKSKKLIRRKTEGPTKDKDETSKSGFLKRIFTKKKSRSGGIVQQSKVTCSASTPNLQSLDAAEVETLPEISAVPRIEVGSRIEHGTSKNQGICVPTGLDGDDMSGHHTGGASVSSSVSSGYGSPRKYQDTITNYQRKPRSEEKKKDTIGKAQSLRVASGTSTFTTSQKMITGPDRLRAHSIEHRPSNVSVATSVSSGYGSAREDLEMSTELGKLRSDSVRSGCLRDNS